MATSSYMDDYKNPNFQFRLRPVPPPPAWKVIKPIQPADCSVRCPHHWPYAQAHQAFAQKAGELENELRSIREKMEIIRKPDPPKQKSTFTDDYVYPGLTGYKYKVVLDSLDGKGLAKPLKDCNEFLHFPHLLKSSGRPHPVTFAVAVPEPAGPNNSEYEDGISAAGLTNVRTSQRHRCPMVKLA